LRFFIECVWDFRAVLVLDSVCERVQLFGWGGRIARGDYGGACPGVYVVSRSGARRFGMCGGVEVGGSLRGIFIFNFPPAKMFMGDSGSTVPGFSVAFLGLDFIGSRSAGGAAGSLLFPFMIAAVPILDALSVVTRRVARGRSPFRSNRGHFYDFLMAGGWTARRVAISC
jgi:UDP-N-acetylmuramyl pentapeptide phosphotransferase/UDP-N-acetylglucosamine-1-phosphate transferase